MSHSDHDWVRRGKLIVFEGVEGGGKTTQLQRCSDWLQETSGWLEGRDSTSERTLLVVTTREPGGTSFGTKVRELLLGEGGYQGTAPKTRTELLLFAADRAQHVEEFLKPKLAQGAIILCDRYTDSTVAYQGYGRGLDLKLIEQLNQIATGGLESDLTLWLDVDLEVGLKRARKRGATDRIEQADIEFHRRVQSGFRLLYQQNPHRIVQVDANGSEQQIHSSIQEILRQRFSEWSNQLSPTS
ncbi:MAG: dTMP kinase [Symploca sp. SIO2G7]|nr:dTMP kinase [Symploca sp. SIO2G7]